jgi:hypothetical protein
VAKDLAPSLAKEQSKGNKQKSHKFHFWFISRYSFFLPVAIIGRLLLHGWYASILLLTCLPLFIHKIKYSHGTFSCLSPSLHPSRPPPQV